MNILVVDDSKEILEALELLLADKNMTLHTASDSRLALELFEKNKFDLIITDINMPVMSGIEISFEVRKKDILVPIILFTGQIHKLKDYAPSIDKLGNTYYVEGKDLNELTKRIESLFPQI